MTSYSVENPCPSWPGFLPKLGLEVEGLGPHPFLDRSVYPPSFCVGRSPYAEGQLTDPDRFLSMRHFIIEFRGSAYWLQNLSVNGTYVNGDYLSGDISERVLVDGDVIAAGLIAIKVHLKPSPFGKLIEDDGDWIKSLRNREISCEDHA